MSTDNARQIASMRSDRAAHAHATAHGDLGAVILTGADYSTVCGALLAARDLLRTERRADEIRGGCLIAPSPLERRVGQAYEAVKSAQRRMPA